MITINENYREVEQFLESMKYTREAIREILDKNIYWEKEFLLKRAKEKGVSKMEEFFNNFDSLCPKMRPSFVEKRKKLVLDTKTKKIYTSLTEVAKSLKLTWSEMYKHIDSGRLKILGK